MTSLLLLAQLTVLTPGHTGSFEYVPDPTPAKVRALAESGKKPLVVTAEIGHERPALTNWAECASAVVSRISSGSFRRRMRIISETRLKSPPP